VLGGGLGNLDSCVCARFRRGGNGRSGVTRVNRAERRFWCGVLRGAPCARVVCERWRRTRRRGQFVVGSETISRALATQAKAKGMKTMQSRQMSFSVCESIR
jgi:hypothetical protein